MTSQKKKLSVHLGETFRAARQQAGLTQAEVAERVGLATEVYGRIERGNTRPSVRSLRRLCMVLQVDANAALAIDGHESARWSQPSTPVQKDPPKLSRLIRTLRALNEPHLAAVHTMVLALAKLPGQQKPPPPEEEPAGEQLKA